ncbi:MAG: indole-3-glycerol phosphate synthase TrpC [Candidatus Kryptoniota bacterium]
MNFLETIINQKRAAVKTAKEKISLDKLMSLVNGTGPRNDFKNAITRGENGNVNVIAEIKRASPSKGIIADNIYPEELARDYKTGGASAISILTESNFFKGSSEDLRCVHQAVQGIPLLRKDFIIDEYQIYESVQIGADAILLIVAALNRGMLEKFIARAKSCGLSSLVEVHSEEDLEIALSAGAEIIGVNNRNLVTFEVFPEVSEKLAQKIPKGIVSVSESGIHDLDGLHAASDAGYHAVLIGEHFMRSKDRAAEVRKFSMSANYSKTQK